LTGSRRSTFAVAGVVGVSSLPYGRWGGAMAASRPCQSISARGFAALFVVALAAPATARSLSFEERVAAQESMEAVYWRHRIWPAANPAPKPALSAVLSGEETRAKVVDYLQKSNALERWWQ